MKKFISIFLAVLLVLSLGATAFADEPAAPTYTLSIVGDDLHPVTDHTYKVYQIFTGDLSEDGVLANIKYGANYIPEGKALGDAVPAAEITAITDAEAFAKSIISKLSGNAIASLSASNNFSAEVAAGYYLVVDDTTVDIPDGDSYSKYMVKVVEDVTMFPKSETEKIEKTLSDDDHGYICAVKNLDGTPKQGHSAEEANAHVHTAECYNWSESNEVSIGETVHFQLKSKVPAIVKDYNIYYFVMGDKACKGLTIDASSIAVYANGTKLAASKYTLTGPVAVSDTTGAYVGGTTFEVALINAKSYAGQTIEVFYDAMLNANANIGTTGNPNEAILSYLRNPYSDSKDTDNDGYPDEGNDKIDGKTPGDDTVTYVTGIKFMKVDQDNKPLQGAEFTVTGTAYKTKLDYVENFVEDANGAFYKLTSGKYTTVAPTVDRMELKTADRDGGFVPAADTDPAASTDKTVNGVRYRQATKEEMADASVALYKFMEGTASQYVDPVQGVYTKYELVGTWTPITESYQVNIVVTTDENGIAVVPGLADGTYHVSETVVPKGYNKIDDFDITITWGAPTAPITSASRCTWTATASNKDGQLTLNTDGVFELPVVNQKGTVLPETGGIGTTIFYVLGSVMLVGAAVLLVTKKRMSVG